MKANMKQNGWTKKGNENESEKGKDVRMKVKKERNRRAGEMKMTIKQRRKDKEHENDMKWLMQLNMDQKYQHQGKVDSEVPFLDEASGRYSSMLDFRTTEKWCGKMFANYLNEKCKTYFV